MAYNEKLAERVRTLFTKKQVRFREINMMGGLCFMVNEKMCVGVEQERLMARVGPDNYAAALQRTGCHEMDFTGRPLKGYVYVEAPALRTQKNLEFWLGLCLAYNPLAQASKKKRKS